ncbi:MAG: TonB-dependent receptor [Acidobacteria bacterium]|nr:TonB-dependent receptor [Acidobacteriota bacterium]
MPGVSKLLTRADFNGAFTDSRGAVPGPSGNAMASFILGYPTFMEQDYTLAWTGQRFIETGLYFADDWRVSRRLTLNLGLRHDYFSPVTEVADRLANFDPATATVKIANRDGVDRRMGIQRNFKDWAPRFGFAYQALKNTVIRGGYGLFYNPSGNGGAALRLFRHVPFGPIYTVAPGDEFVGPSISQGFPAPPTVNFEAAKNPTGGVIGVAPTFRSSYAQQFNLTVQQEITPIQAVLKFAYVGNLGRRLHTSLDLNQPLAGPGPVANRRAFFGVRPGLAGATYAVADGLSNYNAFQFTFDKRMSAGLSVLLGYTWSHAIDDVGTEFGGGTGTPQDIRCRRCDRSNASFDLRHRMTLSYTYLLPILREAKGLTRTLLGGWQLNGITTIQGGLPYTPGLLVANTNGAGGSRPDSVGRSASLGSSATIARWFDPTAFTSPTTIRFGNAGRNILFGPGRVNWDMSLFKDFAIGDRWKVQFRSEAFNIWNTPQFGLPNATIGAGNAGTITSTVGNPRQLQLALRIQF